AIKNSGGIGEETLVIVGHRQLDAFQRDAIVVPEREIAASPVIARVVRQLRSGDIVFDAVIEVAGTEVYLFIA
ncbi:hypothetical protein BLA29_015511, partial [Euroglyphus maynei]